MKHILIALVAALAACATPATLIVETEGRIEGVFDGNVAVVRTDAEGMAWIEGKTTGIVLYGPLWLEEGGFLAARLKPRETVELVLNEDGQLVDAPAWAASVATVWARTFGALPK